MAQRAIGVGGFLVNLESNGVAAAIFGDDGGTGRNIALLKGVTKGCNGVALRASAGVNELHAGDGASWRRCAHRNDGGLAGAASCTATGDRVSAGDGRA